MVSSGTGQSPAKPSQGVLFLLQRSGLMATSQYVYNVVYRYGKILLTIIYILSNSLLQITSAGFQFLLHSPHDQLWDLLLQYLHLAEVGFVVPSGLLILRPSFRNGKWTWSRFWDLYLCFRQWNWAG